MSYDVVCQTQERIYKINLYIAKSYKVVDITDKFKPEEWVKHVINNMKKGNNISINLNCDEKYGTQILNSVDDINFEYYDTGDDSNKGWKVNKFFNHKTNKIELRINYCLDITVLEKQKEIEEKYEKFMKLLNENEEYIQLCKQLVFKRNNSKIIINKDMTPNSSSACLQILNNLSVSNNSCLSDGTFELIING